MLVKMSYSFLFLIVLCFFNSCSKQNITDFDIIHYLNSKEFQEGLKKRGIVDNSECSIENLFFEYSRDIKEGGYTLNVSIEGFVFISLYNGIQTKKYYCQISEDQCQEIKKVGEMIKNSHSEVMYIGTDPNVGNGHYFEMIREKSNAIKTTSIIHRNHLEKKSFYQLKTQILSLLKNNEWFYIKGYHE